MITWSAWTHPFEVPSGALDVFQSLQRLAPGACVAGHCHDGPETGLVVAGTVTRWEDDRGERQIGAGSSFVTPTAVAHATGNATAGDAEQITVHVLPRGAAFARACPCAGSPPGAPGGTNPVRVCFPVASWSARVSVRHSAYAVKGELVVPPSEDTTLIALLDGEFVVGEHRVKVGEGFHVTERSAETFVRGSGFVIRTEVRQFY